MPYTLRNSNICALEEKESDMRSHQQSAEGARLHLDSRRPNCGFRVQGLKVYFFMKVY